MPNNENNTQSNAKSTTWAETFNSWIPSFVQISDASSLQNQPPMNPASQEADLLSPTLPPQHDESSSPPAKVESEIIVLDEETVDIFLKNVALEEEIAKLEAELAVAKDRLALLEKLEHELAHKNQKLAELDAEKIRNIELEEAAKATQQEIVQLKTELKNNKQEKEILQASLKEMAQKAEALENELAKQKSENTLSKERVNTIETICEHKKKEVDLMKAYNEKLQSQLLKANNNASTVNEEIAQRNVDLQSEFTRLETSHQDIRKQNNQLESDRQIQQKLITSYENQIAQKNKQIQTLEAEIKSESLHQKLANSQCLAKGLGSAVLILAGLGALVAGTVFCPALAPVTIAAIKISLPLLIAGGTAIASGVGLGLHTLYKKVSTTPVMDSLNNNSLKPHSLSHLAIAPA